MFSINSESCLDEETIWTQARSNRIMEETVKEVSLFVHFTLQYWMTRGAVHTQVILTIYKTTAEEHRKERHNVTNVSPSVSYVLDRV